MKRKNGLFVFQLLVIITCSLAVRKFLLSPVEVLGASMEPTLEASERLWESPLPTPKRFDIITFSSPRNQKNIIKRIIGLPGDTLYMHNDQLYINDEPVAEPYLDEVKAALAGDTLYTYDFTLSETTGYTVIPENHYFVLGDNRPKADDSRLFGLVEKEAIHGVVHSRYAPFDKWTLF